MSAAVIVRDGRDPAVPHGTQPARVRGQARPDREPDEVLNIGPRVENAEFAAFIRRIIRRHGRRVAEGDPEDLAALLEVRALVDEAIAVAVAGQREQGWSWAKIGRAVGITKQSAQERWGSTT